MQLIETVFVYPLYPHEATTVRWAVRIGPLLAIAVVAYLAAIAFNA